MNSIEARIKKLEDDAKALKGTYNTSGGNVRMYVTQSQTFTKTAAAGQEFIFRVRFNPTYNVGKRSITNIRIKATSPQFQQIASSVNEIQPQDGTLTAKIRLSANFVPVGMTFTIVVTAFGASPGTFTDIS